MFTYKAVAALVALDAETFPVGGGTLFSNKKGEVRKKKKKINSNLPSQGKGAKSKKQHRETHDECSSKIKDRKIQKM